MFMSVEDSKVHFNRKRPPPSPSGKLSGVLGSPVYNDITDVCYRPHTYLRSQGLFRDVKDPLGQKPATRIVLTGSTGAPL